MDLSVESLAQNINAELAGDPNLFSRLISSVAPTSTAGETSVTFISNDKFKASISQSNAGAVIVSEQLDGLKTPQLIVKNVNKALIEALKIFAPKLKTPVAGIHPTAVVAKNAIIGKDVSIDANVIIDDGAVIGSNTIIKSGVKIGENSKIGNNCRIDYNVVIYHNCFIGNNVVIQANSTIGSDGFGYAFINGSHQHIPHNGGVIIEDFVEIGANCCVDRAKFGNTIIGAGTKIDNLVQIAHNVIIGKCCLFAGQVGIAGSTKIGDGVVLAGQVGVIDNLEIGNGVIAGAQSCIVKNAPDGQKLAWSPAYEWNEAMKIIVHTRHLPQMAEQLKQLIKRIEALEAAKNNTK